jgi:nucleotide-binding universal stress UspA family protein
VETVLVGYEQTDAAERALGRAAEMAAAFGARLVVACVAAPMPTPLGEPLPEPAGPLLAAPAVVPPPAAEPGGVPGPDDLAKANVERARAYLAERNVDAEYVADVGDPAERLLDIAERYQADLIVVGTREHGFLERLLARPVDEAVARRARRDVLLVH